MGKKYYLKSHLNTIMDEKDLENSMFLDHDYKLFNIHVSKNTRI